MNYQKASEKQSPSSLKKRPPGNGNSIQNFWNERIMERFIKANLFIICCVVAVLLLVSEESYSNSTFRWNICSSHHLLPDSYSECLTVGYRYQCEKNVCSIK